MVAVIVSLVIVVATLLILALNIGCTGMFTAARPHGDAAMGLVVPIFGLPIAIVALTFAALLATSRVSVSAMGTIAEAPGLSGLIVVALTFGASLAAGMAFMLWCEPGAVSKSLEFLTAPLGILAGVCGPVLLAAMLLVGVWMPRSSAAGAFETSQASGLALKAGFGAVCVLAVIGYSLGGSMAFKGLKQRAANHAAKMARIFEEDAKWEARRNKAPKERLVEDFSTMAPTTPLWCVVTYFLDQSSIQPLDGECRALIVERALKVPDFDAQLEGCLKSTYHMYRTGAAEFLNAVDGAELARRRDVWGRAFVAGVETTGEDIRQQPGWLAEVSDSTPDPLTHVRTLLRTSERFKDWGEYATLRERLQTMADYAGALNADASREKLLSMFADAGYRVPAAPR